MMQILQRISDPEALSGEGDEDPDHEELDLEERLESLDIESADTDTLWEALSPSQKAAFTLAIKDPNNPLAQQLLHLLESDKAMGSQVEKPWWECTGQLETDLLSQSHSIPPYIQVPDSLMSAARHGWEEGVASLLYNVVCLCLSYTFCIRTLQISSFYAAESHDVETCRTLMSQASQFLTNRKSTTRLEDIDTAIAYVQSRLKEPVNKLLPDVSVLFRPELILDITSEQGDSSSAPAPNPCWRLLACLGDIASLYSTPSSSSSSPSKTPQSSPIDKATTHKLIFYAAHVMAAPTAQLRHISNKLAEISAKSSIEDESTNLDLEQRHPSVLAVDSSPDLRFSRGARE